MLANLLRTGGAGLICSDDFNRANGALGSTPVGGLAWTVQQGTITITSNQPVASGTTKPQIATVDAKLADQIAVSALLGTNDAIVLRLADKANYLRVRRNFVPSSTSTVCTPGAWGPYTSTGTTCVNKFSIDPGTYESTVSDCSTTQTKQVVSSTTCNTAPSQLGSTAGWSTQNFQRTRTVTTQQVTNPAQFQVIVEWVSGGTIKFLGQDTTDSSATTETITATLRGNTLTVSGDFGSFDTDITTASVLAANTVCGIAFNTGGSGSASVDNFTVEAV